MTDLNARYQLEITLLPGKKVEFQCVVTDLLTQFSSVGFFDDEERAKRWGAKRVEDLRNKPLQASDYTQL